MKVEGVTAPPPSALKGSGTLEGQRFLVDVLERDEGHLVERARRELSRMLGRDVERLPPPGIERKRVLFDLHTEIEDRN